MRCDVRPHNISAHNDVQHGSIQLLLKQMDRLRVNYMSYCSFLYTIPGIVILKSIRYAIRTPSARNTILLPAIPFAISEIADIYEIIEAQFF